jgi:hypothetical protein
MSKIALSGNASGTGTFTIASPDSSTDRTLTLPDNSGTVLTSATTTGFPAGSVLQVVQASYTAVTSTTSTSFVDTGLSLSITPTSSTSKIAVIIGQTLSPTTGSSNTVGLWRVMRDATQVYSDNRINMYMQFAHSTYTCVLLDSPATTSSVAYKTQMATGNDSFTIEAQHANLRTSTITLMEIAA